jgi:hypothetical protein
MTTLYVAWATTAAVLLLAAIVVGVQIRGKLLGVLIDTRERYSLTQFQIVTWTIVLLSLISGVFWARLIDGSGGQGALDFSIPDELLVVMGITVGSTVAAITVKASKDHLRSSNVARTPTIDKATFFQLFTVEEGQGADTTVDVTKFQNFWITLLLVAAYVVLCVDHFNDISNAAQISALPSFDSDFVKLLAISHGAYLAGKIPNRDGTPNAASAVPLIPPN